MASRGLFTIRGFLTGQTQSSPWQSIESLCRNRFLAFQTDSEVPGRNPIQRVRHLTEEKGFAI